MSCQRATNAKSSLIGHSSESSRDEIRPKPVQNRWRFRHVNVNWSTCGVHISLHVSQTRRQAPGQSNLSSRVKLDCRHLHLSSSIQAQTRLAELVRSCCCWIESHLRQRRRSGSSRRSISHEFSVRRGPDSAGSRHLSRGHHDWLHRPTGKT